mmetsp:Transcript_21116/g.44376  ORF Transcript_21116/g.44376 Transcript_21116/m.44376 type:complete len:328 (-) Transcript_21116:445-1428(-)
MTPAVTWSRGTSGRVWCPRFSGPCPRSGAATVTPVPRPCPFDWRSSLPSSRGRCWTAWRTTTRDGRATKTTPAGRWRFGFLPGIRPTRFPSSSCIPGSSRRPGARGTTKRRCTCSGVSRVFPGPQKTENAPSRRGAATGTTSTAFSNRAPASFRNSKPNTKSRAGARPAAPVRLTTRTLKSLKAARRANQSVTPAKQSMARTKKAFRGPTGSSRKPGNDTGTRCRLSTTTMAPVLLLATMLQKNRCGPWTAERHPVDGPSSCSVPESSDGSTPSIPASFPRRSFRASTTASPPLTAAVVPTRILRPQGSSGTWTPPSRRHCRNWPAS